MSDVDLSEGVASERAERLLALRLNMLARQARRYPAPVLISAAFLAAIAWQHVRPGLVFAWIAALSAILLTRWIYCGRAAQITEADAANLALRRILVLSMANGFVTGLAVVLFFPHLPADLQAIFTMIMVCWAAGAASANASYPRSFYAYALPIMAPLAAAWALDGTLSGVGIASLILFFLVLQIWLVGDNERVLTRSFAVRFENERLLAQIQGEQQRTLSERDRAAEASRTAVAERDRAEAAHRSKNAFMAAASHDLRQPLFAVNVSAILLADHHDETVRAIGRKISYAVDAVEAQLQDLLELARLDSGTIEPREEPVVLDDVIGAVVQGVDEDARRKKLVMVRRVEPGFVVRSDRALFERILRNLLHNATKFTPANGTISISAASTSDGLVVAVADTGCGIAPADHSRVFEEYFQVAGTKGERTGSGLGLAIVKRFCNLLGFEVRLVSQLGAGSIFSIAIPARCVQRGPARPVDAEKAASRAEIAHGLRVLLIDDDAAAREALAALLASWKFCVTEVADAAQAVAAVSETKFDLVIADYHLGPSRTGLEAIAALRQDDRVLRSIVISADPAAATQPNMVESGIRFVEKSASAKSLKDVIAATIAHTAAT